jgi:hypothetical protein
LGRATIATASASARASTTRRPRLRIQLGEYYNLSRNLQVVIDNPMAPTITLEVNDPPATRLYGIA